MKKIIFGIGMVVLAMFAMMIALAIPVAAQEVYLVPQHSSALYCSEKEVEIWVNATEFKSGEMNLTYDPTCANVTNYVWNAVDFPVSGWTHYDGREWITFMTLQPSLTGNYQIGTLTIHCVNDDPAGCTTPLDFVEPSALFDSGGNKIEGVDWRDGTFECTPPEKPDLVVEEKREEWIDIENGRYVVNYTIHNKGTAAAPAGHNTMLYIDGNVVEHKLVPVTLAPCEKYTDTFTTVVDYTPPEDVVKVCADDYNVIDESDETNNCLENILECPVPTENKVFFVPQHSVVEGYCKTTDVEIWVNASNFQSGALNLTYDSGCANVTNWIMSSNFPLGGWDSLIDGRERITFMTMAPLTGEYKVGTLTIHCVNDNLAGCTTPLDFVEPSALFDPYGDEITANWIDGTFECKKGMWCGDVNCNEVVNMGDVTLLLNNVTYGYPICTVWAGDVNCKAGINMGDVTLLLNNVSYPGDPKYSLKCC